MKELKLSLTLSLMLVFTILLALSQAVKAHKFEQAYELARADGESLARTRGGAIDTAFICKARTAKTVTVRD
jgi:hypothetical protein